jgi:hypothetical protein
MEVEGVVNPFCFSQTSSIRSSQSVSAFHIRPFYTLLKYHLLHFTSLHIFSQINPIFDFDFAVLFRSLITITQSIMSSFTSCQSSSMAVFGRGGYNAPVDSGRGGYNAPVDAGRGGYNAPLKRGPDDDDEAEDGRGGYN